MQGVTGDLVLCIVLSRETWGKENRIWTHAGLAMFSTTMTIQPRFIFSLDLYVPLLSKERYLNFAQS